MELYADATGCRTVEPAAPDAVLLGTAMVAAAGAGLHPALAAAGAAMHQGGAVREPDPATRGALRARLAGVPGDAAAPGGSGGDTLVGLTWAPRRTSCYM